MELLFQLEIRLRNLSIIGTQELRLLGLIPIGTPKKLKGRRVTQQARKYNVASRKIESMLKSTILLLWKFILKPGTISKPRIIALCGRVLSKRVYYLCGEHLFVLSYQREEKDVCIPN